MIVLLSLFPIIMILNIILSIAAGTIDVSQGMSEAEKVLNSILLLIFSINGFFFSAFIVRLFHTLSVKNNEKRK